MDPVSAAVASTVSKAAVEPLVKGAQRTVYKRLGRSLDIATAVADVVNDPATTVLSSASLLKGLPADLTVREVQAVIGSAEFVTAMRHMVAIYVLHVPQSGTDHDREDPGLTAMVRDAVRATFVRAFQDRLASGEDALRRAGAQPLVSTAELTNYADAVFERSQSIARHTAIRFLAVVKEPTDAMEWAYASTARLIATAASHYPANLGRLQYTPAEVVEWVATYERSYSAVHSHIELPDLSRRRRVAIEDLYVLPHFETTKRVAAAAPDTAHRLVILGNPGAGKSTASSQLSLASWNSRRVPFYLMLRHIDVDAGGFSVIAEIVRQLRTRYQIEASVELVRYLLDVGRAAVYFDGLDEAGDVGERLNVTGVIETFCQMYPLARTVVTSRSIGYAANALREDLFECTTLLPFEEGQVRTYVTNWFRHAEELTESELVDLVESFMTQSATIDDLRSNPLLLAYMCILYRGKESLPRNRAELFRACAELLLKEWDLRRRIIDDLLDLPLAHRALSRVAHHLLVTGSPLPGVAESELLDMSATYLADKEGVSPSLASAAAHEIVYQCQNRGWIFTNVGTGAAREERWDFTHQSFREYYGARYLHRHGGTAAELAPDLVANLERGRWEILAQVLFLLREDGVAGQASELFTEMLLHRSDASQGDAVLEFLSSSADLVSLDAESVRLLTAQCLERAVAGNGAPLAVLLRDGGRHAESAAGRLREVVGGWVALVDRRTEVELSVGQLWLLAHITSFALEGVPEDVLRPVAALADADFDVAVRRSTLGPDRAAGLEPAMRRHLLLCHGASLGDISSQQRPSLSTMFESLRRRSSFGPVCTADWLVTGMSGVATSAVHRRRAVVLLRSLGQQVVRGVLESENPFPDVVELRLGRTADTAEEKRRLLTAVERALGHGQDAVLGLLVLALSRVELMRATESVHTHDVSSAFDVVDEMWNRLCAAGLVPVAAKQQLERIGRDGWWVPSRAMGVS